VRLIGDGRGHRGGRSVLHALAVDDRDEVAVVEASGDGGNTEGAVHDVSTEQRGQLDGVGHLGADPLRADGAGFDEPALRAVTQADEGQLLGAAGADFGRVRPVARRVVRVVGIDDPRVARGRQQVTGDLHQTAIGVADDDEFVAVDSAPHLGSDMAGGGRVAHRGPPDRLIVVDPAGLAHGRGER
jgi:hypothetical protein